MTPEQLFAAALVLIVGVAWIASVLDERRIRRRHARNFAADHRGRTQLAAPRVSPGVRPGARRDLPTRGGADALSAGTGRAVRTSPPRPVPDFNPSTPTRDKRNRRR